jgi:ATP-dependent exoDNAse (exonuclease V) alpha subunit
VFDRQTLWNVVERSEKRKDAALAREVELSLPRELSREAQIDLVRHYVSDLLVARGMIGDFALHEPAAADGKTNPHAHVLCTVRDLDADTPTGFAPLKNLDWEEPRAVKEALAEARKRYNNTGLEADKAALDAVEAQRNVNVWRAAWADYANRALADAGSAARIDHRTLEAQGIARPAQPNLGLARHIERAYAHLKDRLTQWVAVKKRTALYNEMEHYKRRDPVKLAEFVLRLGDLAEDIAASFRRPPSDQEVSHER